MANLVLVVGFLFIVARSSRHFALNKFSHMFHPADEPNSAGRRLIPQILLSFMDAQASAMGILLFLLTPAGALAFYGCQTLVLSAVYLRYFRRAYTSAAPMCSTRQPGQRAAPAAARRPAASGSGPDTASALAAPACRHEWCREDRTRYSACRYHAYLLPL
jgi:hypothetical protein